MTPLAACAISVSRALPEAWLNNQAYQKVTAMVGSASIGLDPNWCMTKSGACQMVTPMAISTVAARGVRVVCNVGCAHPRKLASSGSWALRGLTMFMAIAIGRLYQTVNSAISGMGAPKAVFRPIDTNETASGTASAIAYQIQLTRQRINRDPIARSTATPSVKNTTISAATRTPGAKKLCHGMAPQLRAQARMKKVTTGCRRTIDTRCPPVLRSLLTSSYDRRCGHKALAGRPPKTQGGFLPCHRELRPVTVRCLGSRAASGLARARSTVLL